MDSRPQKSPKGSSTASIELPGRLDANSIPWYDVSHRTLIALTGPDGLDLLHRISTNDLSHLAVGASTQTVLTNEKGRIVDIISVHRRSSEELLLAGSTSDDEKMISWLNKFIIMERATVASVKESYRQVIITSPKSLSIQKLFTSIGNSIYALGEYWGATQWTRVVVKSVTGSPFVIPGLNPVDLGQEEFDEIRIQNGIPIYPNEINENANPLELGLAHLVSFTKGCYVGQEVIARLDTYGKVQKRICRFKLSAKPDSVPAPIAAEGREAGTLTSWAPRADGSIIGLGFLNSSVSADSKAFASRDGKMTLELW